MIGVGEPGHEHCCMECYDIVLCEPGCPEPPSENLLCHRCLLELNREIEEEDEGL